MSRGLILSLVLVVVVVAVALPAAAIEMRAGPTGRVVSNEIIDDDLYMAGALVAVDGRVRGDLVALGSTVDVRGPVDGGVLAAAASVDITGPIGAAVRAAGGTVVIRGAVGGDVVAAGATVTVAPSSRIARDAALAGGAVSVNGTIGRNVRIAGARVEISGTVGGNAVIRASEVALLPSAEIRGDLRYSSERPIEIAPGARVMGQTIRDAYPARPMPSRQAARGLRIVFGIADFFWMLIIALVLVAVVPGALQTTADALRGRPWASLGWGVLLLIVVPLGIVALMVTLVGIPASLLVLLAHILALFISHAAAALALGQAVAPRLQSRYAEAAIGVGIIAIATNLPYVGWLLRLLVVAVGFGAVALALWGRRATPAAPSPPVPTGPTVA